MDVLTYNGEGIEKISTTVRDFLFEHLEEYGDEIEDIANCLKYAQNRGGAVIIASLDKEIFGAVVLNETGMKG